MEHVRHILITGAGSGIGRAIALRFAASGWALSLTGRRAEALEATAADCMEAGAEVVWTGSCDIRDREAIYSAVAECADANGPLHAVIANAGIGGPNTPEGENGAVDRWDDLIATNLTGTYHTFRAAQRHLAEGAAPPSAGGLTAQAGEARHLVAVASILARIGVGGYTGYCASKAGLLGLTRALAVELAPSNIQVNAVCPGWVDTEMARAGIAGIAEAMGVSWQAAHDHAMREVPLRRMSAPEDVAGLLHWLVSKDARGVTGQAIDINGGAFMS